MRFFVSRTSLFDPAAAPHPRAVRDERGAWVIDVDDLGDLIALARGDSHARVIVDTDEQLSIEFYDDYRE